MITALCNIFINSEEKLGLFKQTFPLAYKISDNWLIYIRGRYNVKVVNFIKKKFPDSKKNCTFFKNLDDDDWAKSTREIMKKSRYDYVYVYLEDHFLLPSLSHFKQVIKSMKKNKIDYFQYSFFNIGLPSYSIEHLYPNEVDHFFTFLLNSKQLSKLRITNKSFYPYSLASISSKKYFIQLLSFERKLLVKVSSIIQALMEIFFFRYPKNRAFWFWINQSTQKIGLRFVIYPIASPFNLEKSLFDCNQELLPLKVGILKKELFANWDDDNMLNNSSLIKRGLYPQHFRIKGQKKPMLTDSKDYVLAKGKSSRHQYCPDVARVTKLPIKYIYVKKGILKVSSSKESFVLNKGQSAWVYANIPHKLLAKKDCIYRLYIE